MTKKDIIIVLFLFIISFIPRLYRLDNPVADWHSWRQADTAAVSRNFIKERFNPLLPQFDSLNSLNGMSDQNPNRYFLAEFPLYNILTYPFYKLFGVNEMYARLVSVFFSSLTSVLLYLLVKQFSSKRSALLAGLFFGILPFSIYYGRVIMPDPLHIFFSVLTMLLVTYWINTSSRIWSVLAGLSYGATLLTKPYALVLILPIAYLVFRKWGLKVFINKASYLFFFLAFVPFLWWRWHIAAHPEGQFGTDWLFNAGNIRFTGAFFRWIIFDRMNRLVFATGGFVLFWLGLIRGRNKKEGWFYYLWLISIFIYISIIAKGNVTHDYYQMPLLPIGCILMAKGFEFLLMFGNGLKQRIVNFLLAIGFVVLMLAFGWYEVRGYFNINHWEIVHAGQAADKILPVDAKVIAPYDNDSAFLYQTNRYGWTTGGLEIEKFVDRGADYLISTTLDEYTKKWIYACNIVEQSDEFVIVDLSNCNKNSESKQSEYLIGL